jgi:hypothetical protein
LAGFFILVFVALVILPQTEMAKTFLLEQTEQLIGQEIRVQKIELALLPSPRLQLVDVEIKNINAHLEYLNARFLDVEILLLPLFLRTVVVKRFILEQPEVTVRLLKKKKEPSSAPSLESKKTVSNVPSFAFEQIAIRQGKLTLRKESKFKGTKDLHIEDILLTLSAESSFSQATVEGSAKTSNPNKGNSILVVSGSIDQQPFRPVVPIQKGNNQAPLQLIGQADLSNFDLAIIYEFLELGTNVQELRRLTDLKSRFTFFPDNEGITMVYSELEGTIGTISIRGRGSLSGLFDEDTTFFASFSSSPIPIRGLDAYIPEALLHPDVRKIMEELEIDGTVELINSVIAGSTADDLPISIVKESQITQGRFLINRKTPPLTNVQGTVVWDNGELRLTNFSGQYRTTNFLDGKGYIQFGESGPWANLQVTSQVDVQDLLKTWNALADPLEIPTMMENLQGTGNVTVKVQGPLQRAETLAFTGIELEDWNISITKDLPPIHLASGTVDFMKDRLTLTGFKAQYGSSKLLNGMGTVQFRKTGPWARVEVDTVINFQNIKSLAAQLGQDIEMPAALESVEGMGNLSLKLKGPLNDLQKIEIEEARLTEGWFKIKPDLSVVQPVVGTASYKDGILRLTDFSTEFGASQIHETSVTVNFQKTEPAMAMEIHSRVMTQDLVDMINQLDPIPEALQPARELEEVAGGARLKAKLHGPLKHPEQLSVLFSDIHLENIGFRTPKVSEPIEQINGRILISNDMMSISNFSGRMRESRVSLDGTLDWRKGNLFKDVVFQANVESDDIKKIRPGILPDALQGTFQLKGVVFGQHDYPRYRIQANLKEIDLNIPDVIHKPSGMPASFKVIGKLQHRKVIIFDQAEFHLPNVSLSGQGTFDTRDPFTISAILESTPISLASIPEEVLFGVKKFQSGDLSLSLEVVGRGTDWRGWQINGSTQLNNVITEDDAPDDPITNISVDVRLTEEEDELRFFMEAIPVKNILPFLGTAEYPLEGEVYGNGLLQGRLEPDQDLFPTLSGKMTLLINEGIIHGGAILPKILSIMNFPSLISGEVEYDRENIPFDSISTDVDVAKGIFHTENYILQSPILVLTGVGQYDLPADQLDVVVGVSPLGSYRSYVEDIPLASSLFGENLLTVFVEVKGPPKEPDIQAMPWESMGTGTKQLFQRSMKALTGAVPLPDED